MQTFEKEGCGGLSTNQSEPKLFFFRSTIKMYLPLPELIYVYRVGFLSYHNWHVSVRAEYYNSQKCISVFPF